MFKIVLFLLPMVSNSYVKVPVWLKIILGKDYIPVLIIYEFFSAVVKMMNSKVNGSLWPKIKLDQDQQQAFSIAHQQETP